MYISPNNNNNNEEKNKIRTNSIGDMPLYGISPKKMKIKENVFELLIIILYNEEKENENTE